MMLVEERNGSYPLLRTDAAPFNRSSRPAQFAHGTSQAQDTLDALRVSGTTLYEYGIDNAFQAINLATVAHNFIVRDMYADLCSPTTDQARRYGTYDSMDFVPLDETGVPTAQRVSAGTDVAFPLRKYGLGLQWTHDYFRNALASEVAGQVDAMLAADYRNIQRQIKNAIFNPTNYTFVDRLSNSVSLPVKRLANGSTASYPIGPNAETFDTDHLHYQAAGLGNNDTIAADGSPNAWPSGSGSATAGDINTDLKNQVKNVQEHFDTGDGFIYINSAQEDDVRSATNFVELKSATILSSITDDRGVGTLNDQRIYNRQIGWFKGFAVWVKPWIPASYILTFIKGAGVEPVLAVRVPKNMNTSSGSLPIIQGGNVVGSGDLYLVIDNPSYPLYARAVERRFGIGVWNRVAASVLYVAATTYAWTDL